MIRATCVTLSTFVCVVMGLSVASDGPRLKVRLANGSQSPNYVVGEPVTLVVEVKNPGETAYIGRKPFLDDCEPEITLQFSPTGVEFEVWRLGVFTAAKRGSTTEALVRGGDWNFDLKLHLAQGKAQGLVFDKPGTYWIKCIYPFFESGNFGGRNSRTDIESNVIKISVKEPTGADAKAWNRIRGADFAYFLQTGYLRERDSKSLKTALTIAESAPETAYHAGIRDALRRYYVRNIYGLKRKEAERLRALLGLQEGHFFPEDKRLGVRVLVDHPGDVPLETIVRLLADLSQVPLRVDEHVGKEIFMDYKSQDTLRDQLSGMALAGSSWKRDGNGYSLAKDTDERYRLDGKTPDELALFNLSLEVGAYAIDHNNELPSRWADLKPVTFRMEELEKATGLKLRERYGFVRGLPQVTWSDDGGRVVLMTRRPVKDRPNEAEGRHAVYRTEKGAIRFRWMTEAEVQDLLGEKTQFAD